VADSVYDLAVKLSLETAGMAGAAGLALRAFGQIEGQATAADRAVANLNRRAVMVNMTGAQRQAFLYSEALGAQTAAHDKLNTAMKGTALLMGGAALVGVSAGLFSFMDKAVKRAEDLQTIMVQVQAATQATPGQMASLQSLAVTQGLRTQFSLNEEGYFCPTPRKGKSSYRRQLWSSSPRSRPAERGSPGSHVGDPPPYAPTRPDLRA